MRSARRVAVLLATVATSVTRRVDGAPKPGVKAKLLEKDGYYFTITDHNLNPDRKFYYELRCGTPRRTVAADSAYPTKPVNG